MTGIILLINSQRGENAVCSTFMYSFLHLCNYSTNIFRVLPELGSILDSEDIAGAKVPAFMELIFSWGERQTIDKQEYLENKQCCGKK